MSKPTIKSMQTLYNSISISNAEKARDIIAFQAIIKNLEAENRWLKALIQDLSASIYAGSKEGSFPRR